MDVYFIFTVGHDDKQFSKDNHRIYEEPAHYDNTNTYKYRYSPRQEVVLRYIVRGFNFFSELAPLSCNQVRRHSNALTTTKEFWIFFFSFFFFFINSRLRENHLREKHETKQAATFKQSFTTQIMLWVKEITLECQLIFCTQSIIHFNGGKRIKSRIHTYVCKHLKCNGMRRDQQQESKTKKKKAEKENPRNYKQQSWE